MKRIIAMALAALLIVLYGTTAAAENQTILEEQGIRLRTLSTRLSDPKSKKHHVDVNFRFENQNGFPTDILFTDVRVDGIPFGDADYSCAANKDTGRTINFWILDMENEEAVRAATGGKSLDARVIVKNGDTGEEIASAEVMIDLTPKAPAKSRKPSTTDEVQSLMDRIKNGPASDSSSGSTSVSVGDHITFGTYEQDGNANNGVEPIEWQVLDIVGNKAFVVSYYGLMNEKYCYHSKSQTWDDSDLRATLNNSFYYESFTPAEREAIQLTHVENSEAQGDPGMESRRGYGIDTEDYIYILSYAELVRYMPTQNDRVAPITNKFLKKGLSGPQKMLGMRTCNYWLRHPVFANNAGGVSWQGIITSAYMNFPSCMVRPCCWVDLTALGY